MDAWMTGLDSGEPIVGLWLLIWWMCWPPPPRTGSLALPLCEFMWLFMYAAGWCYFHNLKTQPIIHTSRGEEEEEKKIGEWPRLVIVSLITITKASDIKTTRWLKFLFLYYTCACMPLWWPPRSPGGTHGSLGPPPVPKLGTVWNGLWSPYAEPPSPPPTGVDAP